MSASANSASSSTAQKGHNTVARPALQALPRKPRKRARNCVRTKWPADDRAKRRAVAATLLEDIVVTPFEETDKLEAPLEVVVEWSPPPVSRRTPPTSPMYDYESCMITPTFEC